MNISTNIANLIDNHTGLFTFGFRYDTEEELLLIFLNYVFSQTNKKELITIKNLESLEDIEKLNFTNKYFIVDYNLLPLPKEYSYNERKLFPENLHNFCVKNNNVAIILTNMFYNTTTFTYNPPKVLMHTSNTIWTLKENILKNIKNRYEMDSYSHNLTAYLRDYKINQILN